ncbi:unnamed protein product [Phytomonas sp. Hart1]|nr:unnamed protein product [Phytomonas sp. Hart1]|eukprot:CCW68346.1 unnamed protein product [Phytomonas sp. isolate Hart1]
MSSDDIDSTNRNVVVWSSEWPYVKQGVSQVRLYVVRKVCRMSNFLDISGRISTGRKFTNATNELASSQMNMVGKTMREKRWKMPAMGIITLSLFVTAKSSPWGMYIMLRNGFLTAAIMTVGIFPREIVRLFISPPSPSSPPPSPC